MGTGKLSFEISELDEFGGEPFEAEVSVQVDVFNSDFELVTKARSKQTIELEEGSYSIAATMPDGSRITDLVNVESDSTAAVSLRWQQGRESKAAARARTRSVSKAGRGKAVHTFDVRFLEWNDDWSPLAQVPTVEVLDVEKSPLELVVSMRIHLVPGDLNEVVRFAQFNIADMERTSVSLPLAPATDADVCQLDLAIAPAHMEIAFRFLGSPEAELTARLLESRQVEEAANLEVLKALLAGKRRDPIGATMAALALHRNGQIDEQALEWMGKLAEWFSWIPDTHVLQAAMSARVRDIDGTLAAAEKAVKAGPPLFTDSGSILDATLRDLARGATYSDSGFDSEEMATSLLKHHGRWFRHADLSELTTTVRNRAEGKGVGEGWRTFRIPKQVMDPSSYWI
jgi:hypothetical protein